jgi:GTPase SAR1 family protein
VSQPAKITPTLSFILSKKEFLVSKKKINSTKMSKRNGGGALHKIIMVGSGGVGKSALTLQVK